MKLPDLIFDDKMIDYHSGQSCHILSANHKGKIVGWIEYSIYDGGIYVEMISVPPDEQRKGYGKSLIIKLQSMFPKVEIQLGYLTADGDQLIKSLPKKYEVDHELRNELTHLKKLKSQFAQLQIKSEKIWKKPNMTKKDKDWLSEVTVHWNELHDMIERLQKEIGNKNFKKTFYRDK